MKTAPCSGCGEITPVSQFPVMANGRRRRLCYPCQDEKKIEDRVQRRLARLARGKPAEGLTVAEYDAMMNAQDSRCAICQEVTEVGGRTLCVDHNHETGQVRGLLCTKCNSGLGMFRDNVEYMKRAIAYLNRDGKRRTGY